MGLFNPFSGIMKGMGQGNGGMLGGLQGLTGLAPAVGGGEGLFSGATDAIDKFKSRRTEGAQPLTPGVAGNVFGERGALANDLLPSFLKHGGNAAGADSMAWLKQAFAELNNKSGLNTQLSEIEHRAQGRGDAMTAGNRFRGSPIGEAMRSAVFGQADAAKQKATQDDQMARFQQGMGLVGMTQQAVTNPLMDVLGISEGSRNQKKSLEMQKSMQPGTMEKVLGGVTSILCWVAREVLPERWQEARAYMLLEAPPSLFVAYALDGERLAKNLTPADRVELRPVFEAMADRGKKYLEA
jgi:hypothetical protein